MNSLLLKLGSSICIAILLMATPRLLLAEIQVQVTDLAGRQLTITPDPQRIVLGESRYLYALSILYRDDPVKRIVGMLGDLEAIDYGNYRLFRQRYPHIDQIPKVGHTTADSFSVEQALNLNADLAIFSVDGHGPNAHHGQFIRQLNRAGVQVVFVDFRNDPVNNTLKSIELLGKVLGREAQAQEFLDFYRQQLERVQLPLNKLSTDSPRPDVFIHSRVGLHDHCCETMVRGMMAEFVDQVQGNNYAAELVPGFAGVLNLEYLLANQPDIYIGTAIGGPQELIATGDGLPPYIALGAGVSETNARASFQRALSDSRLTGLDAVKANRAYAIWHHFYNSPLNVAAVQVVAKWLYPEQFPELDPRQTLQTLFDRFLPIPLEGPYWLSLEEQP